MYSIVQQKRVFCPSLMMSVIVKAVHSSLPVTTILAQSLAGIGSSTGKQT